MLGIAPTHEQLDSIYNVPRYNPACDPFYRLLMGAGSTQFIVSVYGILARSLDLFFEKLGDPDVDPKLVSCFPTQAGLEFRVVGVRITQTRMQILIAMYECWLP